MLARIALPRIACISAVLLICVSMSVLTSCRSNRNDFSPELAGLALVIEGDIDQAMSYYRPPPFTSVQLAQMIAGFEHLAESGKIPRTFILLRADESPYDDLACALTERGFDVSHVLDLETDVRSGKCVMDAYFESAQEVSARRRRPANPVSTLPALKITRVVTATARTTTFEGWALSLNEKSGKWVVDKEQGFLGGTSAYQ